MNGRKDITEAFRAVLEEKAKVQGLVLDVLVPNGVHTPSASPYSKSSPKGHPILPTKKRSAFIQSCKGVFDLMANLGGLLKQNRVAYLSTSKGSPAAGQPRMSERERMKLEEEAEKCLKQCEATIVQLQAKITQQGAANSATQLLDHRSRVLLHLWDVYGEVAATYYQLQSARVENTLEERMGYTGRHQSVLEARRTSRQSLHDSLSTTSPLGHVASSSTSPGGPRSPMDSSGSANDSGLSSPGTLSTSSTPQRVNSFSTHGDDDGDAFYDSAEHRGARVEGLEALDARMQEQLKRENVALQTSLSTMSDGIRQMEQQIVIISQAQQIIGHNLMQQRDDLEHIHRQTKDATAHFSKGNQELEKAAQGSSKFRIFLLIFLLILSFLLLLLHIVEP